MEEAKFFKEFYSDLFPDKADEYLGPNGLKYLRKMWEYVQANYIPRSEVENNIDLILEAAREFGRVNGDEQTWVEYKKLLKSKLLDRKAE